MAVELLSGALRFRPAVELGLQRLIREVEPAVLRRRSSGDAERIRSCPFLTECQADRFDGGDVATSLERLPEGDGTERPFHQVLSEWRLDHEHVLHHG